MYKSYHELGAQPEQQQDILKVTELVDSGHKRHIIATHRVVCIDIYADWCGPCKQTAPDYAVIAATYSSPNNCAVVKYNLDRMDDAERSQIHGIPVFEFYVEGKLTGDKIIGADMQQVESRLKSLLQGTQQRQGMVRDLMPGPSGPRNSIRTTRNTIPPMDSSSGEPYQPRDTYHQPYQTQRH